MILLFHVWLAGKVAYLVKSTVQYREDLKHNITSELRPKLCCCDPEITVRWTDKILFVPLVTDKSRALDQKLQWMFWAIFL